MRKLDADAPVLLCMRPLTRPLMADNVGWVEMRKKTGGYQELKRHVDLESASMTIPRATKYTQAGLRWVCKKYVGLSEGLDETLDGHCRRSASDTK